MEPARLPARHNSGESFTKYAAQLSTHRLVENEDYFSVRGFYKDALARPNESGSGESLHQSIAAEAIRAVLPGASLVARTQRMRGCKSEAGNAGLPGQGAGHRDDGPPAEWTGDRAG
jgi:hypothetical protein